MGVLAVNSGKWVAAIVPDRQNPKLRMSHPSDVTRSTTPKMFFLKFFFFFFFFYIFPSRGHFAAGRLSPFQMNHFHNSLPGGKNSQL